MVVLNNLDYYKQIINEFCNKKLQDLQYLKY